MTVWCFARFLLLFAGGLWGQGADHATGLKAYAAKDYAAASAAFRKALTAERAGTAEQAESSLLLGQSLFLMGKTDEAIAALREAPATTEALYMLGNSYLKKRLMPESVAAFGKMYGVAPGSAAAHLIAAQMMMRQELNDDAEKELLRAVELEPLIPQAHYLLGELYAFRGDGEKAAAELKQEIGLNPASAMAYYKLGDAYSRMGQWAKAIPALQKSVWLNATNSGPYILLGKGYLQQKELGNAEGMLRRAVQMDPQNSMAHYLLGQTLMQEGRTEEGRAMLEQSQKLKN